MNQGTVRSGGHGSVTPASIEGAPLVFSAAMLAAVIVARPLVDAFYESGLVKYLYMLALLGAAYLAWVGRRLGAAPPAAPAAGGDRGILLVLVAGYGAYLLVLAAAEGGPPETIFKVLSPFVLYLAIAPNLTTAFSGAIALSAGIVIVTNLALLPFEHGWTYWGGVRTFKGYFLFKTDLAFALGTSLLLLALHFRFRLNAVVAAAMLACGIQVVLSNARLNYLIFTLVVLYIFVRSGTSPRRLAAQATLAVLLGSAAWLLYDAERFLSPFDAANLNAFTQGRAGIWDVLIQEGFGRNTLGDWLLGRGLQADLALYAEFGDGEEVHNAHNEFLWLLLGQGIVGTLAYAALWWFTLRDAAHGLGRAGLRLALAPVAILAVQGLTATVSPFASKTFPIMLALLLIKAQGIGRPGPPDR